MKLSSLSILIPAYKDEKTIVNVVELAVLAGRRYADRYEIVILNDASPDSLLSVVKKLKREIPTLRIITHKKNLGYGQTIKELYCAGMNKWLFTIPGDFQIDPMEIKKLLSSTRQADMIIGWRKNRYDTNTRIRQSRLYNGLLRLLFRLQLHDVNSVRLMRKSIMDRCTIRSSSAFVDAELTIRAVRDGCRVVEIPISHRPRETRGAGGGKLKTIMPVIRDMILYYFHL